MYVKRHLWLAMVLPFIMNAQDNSKIRFVRATGDATVSARPDRAQISVGVISQTPTAQAAAAANATQTTQVIEAIKRTLGEGGDLKTSGYAISPQYQYSAGRAPKITGFQASNTVLVTVNDLALLGKVIDAASESGATNINGVSFSPERRDSGTRAGVSRSRRQGAGRRRSDCQGAERACHWSPASRNSGSAERQAYDAIVQRHGRQRRAGTDTD